MLIYVITAAVLLLFAYLWYANRHVAQHISTLETRYSSQGADRRHREIFEHSADAVCILEVIAAGKFRFESLNPAAKQALEPLGSGLTYRALDEIAANHQNTEAKRLLKNLLRYLEQAVDTGMRTTYLDTLHLRADEASRTYQINLVPMVDDGGLSHVLCFARDVTSQVLYEQELLERAQLERRFSGFAASAPGFFFSYKHGADGSNAMPFASVGIAELFGLQPGDVEDSIAQMNLRIHPDDMAVFIDRTAQSAAGQTPLDVEFRVNHPERGELWVEARATPIMHADGSIVWHGFMHDITERKKMEQVLQRKRENLVEAQRLGQICSWELDFATDEMSWSDEMGKIFEVEPDLFGATFETFRNAVHPDDIEAVDKALDDSLKSRAPYCIDYRLLFADGRIKHVRECCESFYDADGWPVRSHGTVQDITPIKVVEQQLKDTQDKLRQLVISRELLREDERKRIAWEMHEELGQILAGMKMRVSGLRGRLSQEAPGLDSACAPLNELIDQSIAVVRHIVADLRPTVMLHGVVPSLEWLTAQFNKHPGVTCELVVDEAEGMQADDELSTVVFRVAQEVLEDALRHPGVSLVKLEWRSSQNEYRLAIRHDGEFAPAELTGRHSIKLFGMQERIAAFGGKMIVSDWDRRGIAIDTIFPAREELIQSPVRGELVES